MVSISKLPQSWIQMGVELEGSWVARPQDVANRVRGAQVHHDESVRVGFGFDAEIVTRPTSKLDDLCRDVETLYPDKSNESCGFHIHASFSPMRTSLLASDEFFAHFKRRWKVWGGEMDLPRDHDFWYRLRGKNKYATDLFQPELQLVPGAGTNGTDAARRTRRTMLNFCAWEKHKTVECRLLPMFSTPELAVRAIRELADIYDTYLDSVRFVDIEVTSNLTVVGDVVTETYLSDLPTLTPLEARWEDEHQAIATIPGTMYSIHGLVDMRDDLGLQEEP